MPDIEIKQLLGFKVSLQMLADTDRTDPYRRTGEKKVTDFQSHKAADISNDIVYPEQHIGSMPLLYRFPVYIQVEMKRAESSRSGGTSRLVRQPGETVRKPII